MQRSQGFTIVELLIVLTLVGAAVLGTASFSNATVLIDAARSATRKVVSDRNRAIVEGRFVCVERLPERPVSTRPPSRGVAFTPDGLPRTCDGGGVGNTTILLEHRGRQAAVIVSSLGRVRWELR